MSYETSNKKLDFSLSDKYNFPKMSQNKNFTTSKVSYNNPNISDVSSNSHTNSQMDNESSKEDDENITVSSHVSLNDDDSEVSISNKSNNLHEDSDHFSQENNKSEHSLSDDDIYEEKQLPVKQKAKKTQEKTNFSFQEQSKKGVGDFSSQKFNQRENLEEKFKFYPQNYANRSEKKPETNENYKEFKSKEPKNTTLPFATTRIFNEIKQINNEIDDLEKELEKNFKFYNNMN